MRIESKNWLVQIKCYSLLKNPLIQLPLCTKLHIYDFSLLKVTEGGSNKPLPPPRVLRPKKLRFNRVEIVRKGVLN